MYTITTCRVLYYYIVAHTYFFIFPFIELMKNDQKTKQLSTFREEIRIRGRCATVPSHV